MINLVLGITAYIILVKYLNKIPNFEEKYFICDEIICL